MFNLINRLFNVVFFEFRYKYLLTLSFVRVKKGASLKTGRGIKIHRSIIHLHSNSKLVVEDNAEINNVKLVIKGEVHIGAFSILGTGYLKQKIESSIHGNFILGNHSRIRSKLWIRYGGHLKVGDYTNINEESEIRVDERIEIGDFNQISYKCLIWDTNTHNIYDCHKRRELSIQHFPDLGYEFEKPKTDPIFIGDDCWIGKECAILKGCRIGNRVILGYHTILTRCQIQDDAKVVSKYQYSILINK